AVPERNAEMLRHVGRAWDLVGRGCVAREMPVLGEDKLFGREPAHALHEAALDLANVDRRIERLADVVDDVDARDLHLASGDVDYDLGAGGPVREIVERPAGCGFFVPVNFRRAVETRDD